MDPLNHPGLERVLKAVPPGLLMLDPEGTRARAANALWNLASEPDARLDRWVEGMEKLGRSCQSLEEWQSLGQIQGWRHGLAWLREGALLKWAELREELKAAALGLEETPISYLEEILKDPWVHPGKPKEGARLMLRALGGFRGFGKQFLRTPSVVSCGGRLFAIDQDGQWWAIHADCFGGTLKRVEKPVLGIYRSIDGWELAMGEVQSKPVGKPVLKASFPMLAQHSSAAATATTLVVTTRSSHRIFVIGRVPV
jgi:hypothetical protein